MRVKDLKIREILATNSKKTIEVEIETTKGKTIASVPIGTSRGKHEVVYLPVADVIKNFSNIKRHFISDKFFDLEDVDRFLKVLDKTPNFKNMGGNLALAISSAFLKAFALEEGKEVFEYLSKEKPTIPLPVCNVAGRKGRKDIEEFLLIPSKGTFLENISKISSVYLEMGKKIKEIDKNFDFGKDFESAWLTLLHPEKLLDVLTGIAEEYKLNTGLDIAASQLWDGRNYVYSTGEKLTTMEQLNFVEELAKKYSIAYIEDPFHEDDFTSFATLNHRLKDRLMVGDDLFSTSLSRLEYGISYKSANAVIIKPNQAGTITDTLKVIELAKKNNIKTIVSHRSGETDDTLICHLAVGMNCDYVKIGISGERITKINEMIRIEEKIEIL